MTDTLRGLTMEYPLTIAAIARRAEALWVARPIVSRTRGAPHRSTYGECLARARRLAAALHQLGVRPGDRVATLCWNHHRHFEAYFAVPLLGAVLHTLNLRFHPEELAYIATHAEDRVVLVGPSLLPLLESFRGRTAIRHVIVAGERGQAPDRMLDYESLLADAPELDLSASEPDERDAASMCYTSGTTGRPKAVVYSHRTLVLHSMATAMAGSFAISAADTVLAAVPMFHANGWGLPYTAALTGAGLVFPGEHPGALTLLDLCHSESVTFSAGVPTVWLGVLDALDAAPGEWKLPGLRIVIGGAAGPEGLVRGLEERHGVRPITSWGMTEIAPVGTVDGRPGALLELRVRNEAGLVPWDGVTMGELEVRGGYVASAYYRPDEKTESFTEDGWFRTGDIASIDAEGRLEIRDRSKDLIKSGGEWISSVALEGALMTHPAVVLRSGAAATAEELRAWLAGRFPAWWLPDDVVFMPAIPRTSTGKFRKSELRDTLRVQLDTG